MYDSIDFHDLAPPEQRQLIHNRRAATTDGLLREIPEGEPPVRIFEQSVEEFILDRLEQGRYSNAELAEEFSIQEMDVRRIVNKYRRRGSDDFTNESFKYNLLTARDGVIRVKDIDGNAFYYTLEKIPFFARVVDPTLGVSLMNIDDRMQDFPCLADHIPAGKASDLDETYAVLIGDFWGIDPQEIFDFITEFDRKYFETSLMPFPVVDAADEYDRVTSRFKQHSDIHNWYRTPEKLIDTVGEDFMDVVERGNPGIRMYQLTYLEFADLKWYAETTDPELLQPINDWTDTIVDTLHPDTDTTDDTPTTTETENTGTISIEDEVLSVLNDDFQTPADVFESLPAMVQTEATQEEVHESLERLAGLGIIKKETRNGTTEYNADTGTVSRESIL
ncbi:hypothetical protein [Natronorubrum sp. A-ect3]|uniref:hypothetical protein n=1 Tax=Natronorubrum sp. A-ect3 TaxID=3242698 RepID=UPI00359D4C38